MLLWGPRGSEVWLFCPCPRLGGSSAPLVREARPQWPPNHSSCRLAKFLTWGLKPKREEADAARSDSLGPGQVQGRLCPSPRSWGIARQPRLAELGSRAWLLMGSGRERSSYQWPSQLYSTFPFFSIPAYLEAWGDPLVRHSDGLNASV